MPSDPYTWQKETVLTIYHYQAPSVGENEKNDSEPQFITKQKALIMNGEGLTTPQVKKIK
jgi:hypothetical protein